MIHILLFVLCLVTCSASYTVDDIQNTRNEDLEWERQLKLINNNKPPVKSIHTKFGDIVDCIDINKQPAFDHPLLKNHKLQRKPTFQKTIGSVKNSPTRPIFGLEKDQYCPIGTVPIKRTTKDDLIRGKSLLNYHIMTEVVSGLHVAEIIPKSDSAPFYGVSGINSVYNPKTQADQISGSYLWVENGPRDTNNKIAAGWIVHPELNGDDATYTYTTWTSDNFANTGCYNMRCPGFVQTHQGNYIGARLVNISTYEGVNWEIPVSIVQDNATKNWWLNIAGTSVGYFPATLFSDMSSASVVGWGGATRTSPGTLSPPMGSGHLPDHNFAHACYFRQVSYYVAPGRDYKPLKTEVGGIVDKSDCFDAAYYGDDENDGAYKYGVQFGGPGGNCGD